MVYINKEICSKCGHLYAFIIDDTMSFDKNPYLYVQIHCLQPNVGVFFTGHQKIVEKYVLKNNKWKRIEKSSFFRKYSDKQLDEKIKNRITDDNCPYYLEHQISNWNK